jgi:PAS domain S-box-containing protein
MKILIIEDNPADVELIREILSDHREPVFDIVHAGTLMTGLSSLSEGEIDVILLDLGLPDSQGIDTVGVVRESNPAIAIVVLTGLDDDEAGFRALQEGAQDYLVKGEMSSPLLVRSVRYAIERNRAEQALRESEEKYRTLFESAGDSLLIHDLDGRLLDVNQATVGRLGYSREELLAMNLTEIVPPEFAALVPDRIRKVVEIGHMVFETIHVTRDGRHIPIEASARVISYQGETAILSISRDITDRKRAEETLMRHTEELVRKSRELEAARHEANMYLDIMTHDVRNANNVSSMYADLLAELADGDLKVYVEKLHASISRSSEILKNVATIRRVSEESTDRLVPVNLDAVIRDEIGNYPEGLIRYTGLEVDVIADGLLPTVCNNLLGNAVKFGGGDVAITIRVEECDGEVLVSVEDTGPGVPDEVKSRLFRRFERGTARGSGQGLGLFIVRTLVERYGGKVRVEDRIPGRPEEGAAFRFTLIKA